MLYYKKSKSAIPGFDVNVSLATVGLKLNSLDINSSIAQSDNNRLNANCVQTDSNRLNSTCTDVIFTLRTNASLNTTQVYVTFQREINLEHFQDNYS